MLPVADVFISHASEDKDQIARPLAAALSKRGVRVWYDEYVLTAGDRLRERIDEGLRGSRFGLVILSPAFIRKEWSRGEFDALWAREMSGEGKVLLPIIFQMTWQQAFSFSPLLAGRLCLFYNADLDMLIEQILAAMGWSSPTNATSGEPRDIVDEDLRPVVDQLILSLCREYSLNEPLRTGVELLRKVTAPGVNSSEAAAFVRTALVTFQRVNENPSPMVQAAIEYYAGVCHLLLNAHESSRACLKRSITQLIMVFENWLDVDMSSLGMYLVRLLQTEAAAEIMMRIDAICVALGEILQNERAALHAARARIAT